MTYRIYHIGFVTRDLQQALSFYESLGFKGENIHEDPVDKFRAATVDVDGIRLLLMEPTDPAGPVGRYLSKRGEGFHHLAFEVEDCRAAQQELRAKGIEFFFEVPREQWYEVGTFIKPVSAAGVLVELVQPKV